MRMPFSVVGFGVGFVVAVAFAGEAGHRRIQAPEVPLRAGAPYSQAVMAGDLLYLSGNIGTDPATGKLPTAFADQAKQSLTNLGHVLKAGGCGWEDVLKVNVYVEDMARYEEFNQIYTTHLPKPYPARTFLAVADIPGGSQIEIEAVAAKHH